MKSRHSVVKNSRDSVSRSLPCSIVLYETDLTKIQDAIESCLFGGLEVEITIIDNSPDDRLRQPIEAMGVKYTWTGKNLGYGAGHNLALRKTLQSSSKYHLVVNPDVNFGSEVLPTLYDFMESNPEVGLVMPRVLYPDDREQQLCKLLPTPLDLVLRRFGSTWTQRIFRERVDRFVLRSADITTPRVVPSLSGCFMFLRTSVLRKVGLFDERYFLYMEDVDLSRRIAEVSKTVFFPEVSIYHEHGQSSYKNTRALGYHLRSAFQYFDKWGWFEDRDRERLNRETLSDRSEFAAAQPDVKAA